MFVRLFRPMVVACFLLYIVLTVSSAAAVNCQYVFGFKDIHDLIPQTVGDCLVDEHHGANGDALQETTGPTGKGGLLVWRKSDNWTAYTDGYHTWVNGPHGLQQRLNTERFPWEQDTPTGSVPPSPTPAQTDAPTQILFTSTRESANDIWVANSDGSSAKRLTFDGQNFGASWSPDKSKIAFEHLQDRGNGLRWSIVTMNSDGTGATNLTPYSDTDEYDPSWLPDGSRILYAAKYPGQQWEQIYTERADGTDRKQVTQGPGTKGEPRLSPDGSKIVFRSDVDQDQGVKDPSPLQRGVFVVNSDGANLHKLTHNAQYNIDPTWSPDSSMIAFVTFKKAQPFGGTPTWDITVMNADGGNSHVIKSVSGRTIDYLRNIAAWRGSRLLVQADYNGHWVPKFINQDGSGLTVIADFELSGADDMATDWR